MWGEVSPFVWPEDRVMALDASGGEGREWKGIRGGEREETVWGETVEG